MTIVGAPNKLWGGVVALSFLAGCSQPISGEKKGIGASAVTVTSEQPFSNWRPIRMARPMDGVTLLSRDASDLESEEQENAKVIVSKAKGGEDLKNRYEVILGDDTRHQVETRTVISGGAYEMMGQIYLDLALGYDYLMHPAVKPVTSCPSGFELILPGAKPVKLKPTVSLEGTGECAANLFMLLMSDVGIDLDAARTALKDGSANLRWDEQVGPMVAFERVSVDLNKLIGTAEPKARVEEVSERLYDEFGFKYSELIKSKIREAINAGRPFAEINLNRPSKHTKRVGVRQPLQMNIVMGEFIRLVSVLSPNEDRGLGLATQIKAGHKYTLTLHELEEHSSELREPSIVPTYSESCSAQSLFCKEVAAVCSGKSIRARAQKTPFVFEYTKSDGLLQPISVTDSTLRHVCANPGVLSRAQAIADALEPARGGFQAILDPGEQMDEVDCNTCTVACVEPFGFSLEELKTSPELNCSEKVKSTRIEVRYSNPYLKTWKPASLDFDFTKAIDVSVSQLSPEFPKEVCKVQAQRLTDTSLELFLDLDDPCMKTLGVKPDEEMQILLKNVHVATRQEACGSVVTETKQLSLWEREATVTTVCAHNNEILSATRKNPNEAVKPHLVDVKNKTRMRLSLRDAGEKQ